MVMSNGCVTVNPYSSANTKEEYVIKNEKIECQYILTNTNIETIIYYIVGELTPP